MNGKKVLVTGGTRGIGFVVAKRLYNEGGEVFVTGTKETGCGPKGTSYLSVDFSTAQATDSFVDEIATMGFDVLVNNAGINIISPFVEIDPVDFQRIQQVNVIAPMLICRAAIPRMRTKGWGRIVNISSIWGKVVREYRGAYAASKFALDGLTSAIAAEVARDGILANCVAPGFIETDLTRQVLGQDGIREVEQQVPIGRLGQPEEIAALVAWLASPENTYISGQNIAIDGGFSRV